jgi:hypothetical protein
MTTPLEELEKAFGEASVEQWSVLTAVPVARPCPACFGPAVEGKFAVGRGFDIEHSVVRVYCFYCQLDLNTCETHGGAVVSWGMVTYVEDPDQFRRPE